MLVYSFLAALTAAEQTAAIEEARQDFIEARDHFASGGNTRSAKEMDDMATACLVRLARLKEATT